MLHTYATKGNNTLSTRARRAHDGDGVGQYGCGAKPCTTVLDTVGERESGKEVRSGQRGNAGADGTEVRWIATRKERGRDEMSV